MLKGSQPLDPKAAQRLGLEDNRKPDTAEDEIVSQRIGMMFDDILSGIERGKSSLKIRIGWCLRRIKEFFLNMKHILGNHRKWHKTMRGLRPWEGFDGLISVMLTHLNDYVEHEEKHGYAAPEYRKQKIASVKETIELLERMKEPDGYTGRRHAGAEAKYPAYQSLVTEYRSGSTSFSGKFVAQGDGWTGIESGNDPREGYFEFSGGQFELATSPDQVETDRLLAEIRQYYKDMDAAYTQAETDSDEDFERLASLLRENLYTWWD